MANIKNLANCANPESIFNVGTPLCDLKRRKLRGIIFLDKGVTFSLDELSTVATFIAAVKAATVAPRGQRAYPVWDITNFEDNTGEPTTGGVGNLSTATIVTGDAVPAFSFGYNGAEIRHKRLAGLAGASLDVLFVDDQWAVFGTEKGPELGGYDVLETYVNAAKFIVSDAVNQYSFRISLSSIAQYRDLSMFVLANAGISSAVGLININNELDGPFATATFTIVPTADGGTNLQEVYGATLASAPLWRARRADTNANVVVSTVVQNVAKRGYDITIAAGDFAALAVGAGLKVNEAIASALSAAGIAPYEGVEVTIVKTAP